MVFGLVRKGLRGRYKASFLGFLWTFVNPLLQLLVYSMVFSFIMRVQVKNYPIYLFIGLIPWFFLATTLTSSTECIVASKNLVNKIYFPRLVLPISVVTENLVNLLLSMVIVIIAVAVGGVGLSVSIVALPIVIGIQYLFLMGVSFVLSALYVYFRDLKHIISILVLAWFYLTPIVYTLEMVPEKLMRLIKLNPMTEIITAYRNILYYKCLPDFSEMWLPVVLGVFFLIFGGFLFQKLQKGFAEEL